MSKFEVLAERVERLLLRHAELQRTNALLNEQIQTLTQERDLMRSRLNAARNRIDALLDRLPQAAAQPQASDAPPQQPARSDFL
jgi:cell division protein ZapB